MINRWITIKSDINGLCAHQKSQNLNATTSSVFGDINDIRMQLISCVAIFVTGLLAVSFISTILPTCNEKPSSNSLSAGKEKPSSNSLSAGKEKTSSFSLSEGKEKPSSNSLSEGKEKPSSINLATCDDKTFSKSHIVLHVVICLFFTCLTVWSVSLYLRLLDLQMDTCKTDFHDLHDKMISSLKKNFGSDNFTIGTNISFEWNNLFIDYECCGVNKVVGTTNDFDSTSWCTTSGSCQATASQIPKTCCKGLTKYDYQNAPTKCHSSVNGGEYYEKGCYSVIKKELIKERIQFDTVVDYLLTEWFKVVLAMGLCSLIGLCGLISSIVCWNKTNAGKTNKKTQRTSL